MTLCGWVDSYRDHGGGLFVDLRDRYGKTQVVFGPESGGPVLNTSRALRAEFVISVTGKIAHRPEGTVNDKLPTGAIEVRCSQLQILNPSLTPVVSPSQTELPGEDLRLKHRYLDLRRPEMQKTLFLRSQIVNRGNLWSNEVRSALV